MILKKQEALLQLKTFLKENFIFDDAVANELDVGTDLIGEGIVDSFGILSLIDFLEQKFEVKFEDEEIVPENLGSLDSICAFLAGKGKILSSIGSSGPASPDGHIAAA